MQRQLRFVSTKFFSISISVQSFNSPSIMAETSDDEQVFNCEYLQAEFFLTCQYIIIPRPR